MYVYGGFESIFIELLELFQVWLSTTTFSFIMHFFSFALEMDDGFCNI